MPFSVEVTPRNDTSGVSAHAVVVTIDGHETVLTFGSKDDAESFAQVERARLIEDEEKASQRVAKGLYLMPDGQVLVEYGRHRRVPIPPAQYKANGYSPSCDKLPAEAPREVGGACRWADSSPRKQSRDQ